MTNEERAIAYAAMKALEKMLETDGELPPGFFMDCSNHSLTITLPEGTTVSRDLGEKRDGKILKKATQNLYGYAVWCLFLQRLNKFNQAGVVRKILMEAWTEAMKLPKDDKPNVEELLRKADPEIGKFILELKAKPGAMRSEMTPRMVKRKIEVAALNFNTLSQLRKVA